MPVKPSRPKTEQATQRSLDSRAEDKRLIAQALSGIQPAYRALLKKYRNQVYNTLFRMVHQRDEVEDLTQEAFIKAFVSLKNYNGEYAFSTWLLRIAQNNCIDFIRKKKLQTFSIDKPIESKDGEIIFELPDSTYEPDRVLIASQRAHAIEEAIKSLPPKYRTVIIMRHSEEKDYQEIADELGVPIGTVKANIFRAREMLNKTLRKKIQQY
jgi:RNA polymerase sigma-70 factor (ECF subfamily)